jgi:hypothetical protein
MRFKALISWLMSYASPEINFSTITTIRTNQGVGEEDYKIKDENNPSYIFPIEDDDKLNSSDLNISEKIKCNHHHY